MAAALTQLTGGNFTDSEGNVLANGYLTFQLSQDGNVAGVGNLCSGITVKIQLDSTGNVAGVSSTPPVSNQYLWANANISPINTFYKVKGYTAAGQRAWGLNNQQIGAGATFNLGSWVPNQVIQWFPTIGATPLAVEVRGAAFSSTTLLNFESSDSSVTITDEGSGLLNFQSAGNTSSPSGSNVVTLPVLNPSTSSAGLNGYTVVLRIPSTYLVAVGTSVRIGILTTPTLPFVVNAASVGATLPNSTVWTTAPTSVTWPGGSFSSTGTLYLSNAVDIVVDTAHDYYVMVYIDPSSSGGDAYFTTPTATTDVWQSYQGLAGYLTGNHSNDSDASSVKSPAGSNIFSIAQVVIT